MFSKMSISSMGPTYSVGTAGFFCKGKAVVACLSTTDWECMVLYLQSSSFCIDCMGTWCLRIKVCWDMILCGLVYRYLSTELCGVTPQ